MENAWCNLLKQIRKGGIIMANYPSSGNIEWTGHSTPKSTIKLSYPYTTKALQFGAVVNGTMGFSTVGKISVSPTNYEFKIGDKIKSIEFGSQSYGTTLPIDVTPKSAYENTRIELLVSIVGTASDVYLTAHVNVG